MNTPFATPQIAPERNGYFHPAPAPTPSRSNPPDRQRAGRWVLALSVLVVVGLSGALAAGTLPRWEQETQVNAAAHEAATAAPRVTVAVARRAGAVTERTLPGNSLALVEAALFARTTGYLKERLVDFGDHVKEGQLLAVISAPDVDDQLAQARANLASGPTWSWRRPTPRWRRSPWTVT